jgi:hypothetical protein
MYDVTVQGAGEEQGLDVRHFCFVAAAREDDLD